MLRQPDMPAQIAEALCQQDYLVLPNALTDAGVEALRTELQDFRTAGRLRPAAVGRGQNRQLANHTRSDLTCWLTGETAAQQQWLAAMTMLRTMLNQRLLLGLNDYECHYACYPAGAFYRRHVDSFRGNNARQISTVLYLNEDWHDADGGLLKLYQGDQELISVKPEAGTLVIFLSETVPHEVTEARRERLSIAGWMRRDAMLSR